MAMDVEKLRLRAAAGSPSAQSVLGAYYLDGIEVEANYEEAHRLLSAAAKQGASRAVFNLARMHAEGLGVGKDVSKAVQLYESVASREFLALVALGRIYSRGTGITPDPAEAFRCYSAAVDWEAIVGDCDEIREAKAYVGRM
jgi:TPR repeat protein